MPLLKCRIRISKCRVGYSGVVLRIRHLSCHEVMATAVALAPYGDPLILILSPNSPEPGSVQGAGGRGQLTSSEGALRLPALFMISTVQAFLQECDSMRPLVFNVYN